MIVFSGHQALRQALPRAAGAAGRAVVIGNFDGVHLGHQALFAEARRRVGPDGTVLAMTFWPHPARVLVPSSRSPLPAGAGSGPVAIGGGLPLILSQGRRRERLAECGIDILVEQPFDLGFAGLSPRDFVDEVLITSLGARWVVVGHDFNFGKGRSGTLPMLSELLRAHGAEACIVPAFTVSDPDGGPAIVCSSTFVRREVQAGRPERAALVLGRDVEVEGEVVHGAARGRTIGIPTANLRPDAELQPAVGIYAAWAEIIGPSAAGPAALDRKVVPRPVLERHPAAVSVGYNATFTAGDAAVPPLSIEAHLIQPSGAPPLPSLYGQVLRLHLRRRLRDEQRFSSVEALVAQIHRDIEMTQAILGIGPPHTASGPLAKGGADGPPG